MRAKSSIWLLTILAITSQISRGQAPPRSGLYQIVSGSYSECCGIAGELGYPLPNERQAFANLKIDSETTLARMTFLANNQQTIFTVFPCPPTPPFSFDFENGVVSSNEI